MWQLLEVKARFIAQIMCGQVSTRRVEDLENAALTFAEIKAIASGNPLVMEKVRVDTEIRKLDALRATHQNQLYRVSRQMAELPYSIERLRQMIAQIQADIRLRNEQDTESFSMKIGNREYSGKGAREEAAKALTYLVLTWKDDEARELRAHFRGFQILSQGKRASFLEPAPVPSLFVHGSGTYTATLNQPKGGHDADTPMSKLDIAMATKNNATLFDNGGGSDRIFGDRRLALTLLTFQCFSPGGRIGVALWGGLDTGDGSSEHAPCVSGGVLHTFHRGSDLCETFHLNLLHKQQVRQLFGDSRWGRPVWESMPISASDGAAYENATQTYLGRLASLARAVRLSGDGCAMLYANGLTYPENESPRRQR
jgi:hypothetical protein